eukprot:TRINITY_DN18731_c0_g1_i5.p1 TRINITY_DN18731_c0_g1~~TRINITY_DN18731_c0_g1_i5.p1  ORF type:complete len:644 (-),score=99.35 TRINITY_DN18731_c0_g1_i5:448-2334(-)
MSSASSSLGWRGAMHTLSATLPAETWHCHGLGRLQRGCGGVVGCPAPSSYGGAAGSRASRGLLSCGGVGASVEEPRRGGESASSSMSGSMARLLGSGAALALAAARVGTSSAPRRGSCFDSLLVCPFSGRRRTVVTLSAARAAGKVTQASVPSVNFRSSSSTAVATEEDEMPLPPMSLDGGSQPEFEEYWEANKSPVRYTQGWIERCAHPQVNNERYWYNEKTDELTYMKPAKLRKSQAKAKADGLEELSGDGPAWSMNIQELKEAMAFGRDKELGLTIEELAKRAVAEYEKFEPRVLSWHDYQHNTFWFFGGLSGRLKKQEKGEARDHGFFNKGASSDLFASEAFFKTAAEIMTPRLHRMHPICLTYFVWTFSRADVVVPEFMEAVGNHLCDGRLPMMDRCSLGTMVWNFSKQSLSHERLFEAAATELSRSNRTRALAPRNFQNTLIAYGRRRHWNMRLFTVLAKGMRRLLDAHDPRRVKLDNAMCFPYTCKDGYVVLADCFHIGGLTAILKHFLRVPEMDESIENCILSMLDYTRRSVERSPPPMRSPGDACDFLLTYLRICEAWPHHSFRDHIPHGSDVETLCHTAQRLQKERVFSLLGKLSRRDQQTTQSTCLATFCESRNIQL